MQKLYSFDIFDTCLVRTCGKPENLLYSLAYKVLGADVDFVLVRDFVRIRRNAELELFRQGEESATIEQIYSSLDFSHYTPLSSSQIMEMEKSLEMEILVPVKEVVKRIEDCRRKGRVIFISDMYFSGAFLRKLLEKHGIINSDEHIYVSCDYQATKRTGRLFDIVKEKEGVSFRQWTHFGDDQNNDYIVPKRKGIKTVRIKNDYIEYERLCEVNSPYASNKIAASVFSGILRSARLALNLKDDGGFLTGVMCGLIIPFVAACMQDAVSRGIKRLYFASRDAYVMFLVAKQFESHFPNLELRYLYLSTRTIYPTFIENGSRDEISLLLNNIFEFKPKSILKLLGYDEEDICSLKEFISVEETCRFGDKTSNQLIEWLGQEEQTVRLKNKGSDSKKLLLNYLEQEGFINSDSVKVGLVDIGWRCSSQNVLSKVIGNKAMYYYYGVVKENFSSKDMGEYKPFFYTDIVGTNHPKLLECYICKNLENTVIGYDRDSNGTIKARFASVQISQEQIDDFNLRKNVLETCASYYAKYDFLVKESDELFNSCSCRIMKNVLDNPSKQISTFLADKLIWDHYVAEQKLIQKLYPHTIINYIYWRLTNPAKLKKYANLWREACLSYTYGCWTPIIKYLIGGLRYLKSFI